MTNPSPPLSPRTPEDIARLRSIATYQRFVNVVILCNILMFLLRNFLPASAVTLANGLLGVAGLASAVVLVLLANLLYGLGLAIVCAFLGLIPCVNLLTLLAINQAATTRLRQAGYNVGLLGANPDDIR